MNIGQPCKPPVLFPYFTSATASAIPPGEPWPCRKGVVIASSTISAYLNPRNNPFPSSSPGIPGYAAQRLTRKVAESPNSKYSPAHQPR